MMMCCVKNCVTRMHLDCAQKSIGYKLDIDNTTVTISTGLVLRNVGYCLFIYKFVCVLFRQDV